VIPVRRNSTEFALVAKLIKEYARKKERKKLIKLYALKPGEKLAKKILLDDAAHKVVYDLNYETILEYLVDPNQKLYREKEEPFYYFKSSPKSEWIEFPFEFTGRLKQRLFPLRKA
jgi:hypothetical protein